MQALRNPLVFCLSGLARSILFTLEAKGVGRVPLARLGQVVDMCGVYHMDAINTAVAQLVLTGFVHREKGRYRGVEGEILTVLPWDGSFKHSLFTAPATWMPKQWTTSGYIGPDECAWTRDPKTKAVEVDEEELRSLFEVWKDTTGHERAKMSATRKSYLKKMLSERTPDEVRLAIVGMGYSDWHMGRAEGSTVRYDDIKYVHKNFDTFLQLAEENGVL